MATELLAALIRANLALAAAILLILVLRAPVRAWFGANAGYTLWAMAPLTSLASVLPARQVIIAVLPTIAAQTATSTEAISNSVASTIQTGSETPLELFVVGSDLWSALASLDATVLLALWGAGVALSLSILAWRQQDYVDKLGMLARADAEGLRVFRAQSLAVGPALVGVLRPRIVLPHNFETHFNSDERALILEHERTHLSRGDAQTNALIALLSCIFWFNPLARFAAFLAKRDQELACDADVIARFPDLRALYARALLKTQLLGAPVPIGCAWPSRRVGPLQQRFMLLSAPTPTLRRRLAGLAVVVALCASGGGVAWAARPAVRHMTEVRAATISGRSSASPTALAPVVQDDSALVSVFANRAIELRGMAGILHVIPEDRADIAVSIAQDAHLGVVSTRVELGLLVIDGGLGVGPHRCEQRFTGTGLAHVPGIGDVRAEDLPVVTLRVPRTINLRVRGIVASEIGNLDGGRIQIDGCGDSRIGQASRALEVGLFGFGNVDVGAVHGPLIAKLLGVGNLSVKRADQTAQLNLIGTGDLNSGPVAGAATVLMEGSGALRVESVTGPMNADLKGAGPVILQTLTGPKLDVSISGSSDLRIAAGVTDKMSVRNTGSGSVTFGGRAEKVDAYFGDGAPDILIAQAGQVDIRRSRWTRGRVLIGQR